MDTTYGNNQIRKKINKIFDSHIVIDSSEVLNVISGLCADTPNTKRIIINEIERRDMLINKTVLLELGKVKDKINNLLGIVVKLDKSVKDMSERLQESKTKTHHLISQTTKIREENRRNEKKNLWVNKLIQNFQLSPDEIEYLYNVPAKTPLTSEFLKTLKNMENLFEKSKVLMKYWYQTPAYDIMETYSLQQEMAMEKLFHWTTGVCRSIDAPNNAIIPKALAKFQNRQVLFANIVDEYVTARKTAIVQLFIDALTKGSDSGAKPIEFYGNDEKRYITDMLMWVHQRIPIEKDNISSLFQYCENIDKTQLTTETLISLMEAICPLMKVRVELVLKPEKDPLVLWSVINIFHNFKNDMKQIIPKGSMNDTIDSLILKSEENFKISLNNKVQKELSYGVKAPSTDLHPSNIVTNLVGFLRDLLTVMNGSTNSEVVDKKIVASHLLDPLLHAINETACHLSSTDMAVYMLNCIYHIQCSLSLYQFMDDYNERLQAQSEAQIDTLTSEQASFLVANLNLGPIYTILQEKISGPLSAVPGMDAATLKSYLIKFDAFLSSPESYLLPQLKLLISHTHKTGVAKRAFQVISVIYKNMYEALHNPINGYLDPKQIITRSPEDVEKILL